jgi:hypothetical protein
VSIPGETAQGKGNDQQQEEAKAGTHGDSLEAGPPIGNGLVNCVPE